MIDLVFEKIRTGWLWISPLETHVQCDGRGCHGARGCHFFKLPSIIKKCCHEERLRGLLSLQEKKRYKGKRRGGARTPTVSRLSLQISYSRRRVARKSCVGLGRRWACATQRKKLGIISPMSQTVWAGIGLCHAGRILAF